MSPLQQVAMGLVLVFGRAMLPADPNPAWRQYDALPDPLGWLLVVVGVWRLARTDDAFATARSAALLATVVSVPLWLPEVNHLLDENGRWAASLPQIGFCWVLARQVHLAARAQDPPDTYAVERFRALSWAFVAVAVLPVVALGGGVDLLRAPTDAISIFAGLALVFYCFRVHRRTWLGGPGPVEAPATGRR